MTMSTDNTNAASSDKHNTLSSQNIVATSAEDISTTSTENINATSTESIKTTSIRNIDTLSTSNDGGPSSAPLASTSSDNVISTPPNDTTSIHASTVTTSTKRKQASPDPQEETQGSLKKKARTLRDFDYIRDTFGYAFKDLSLLNEALNATPAHRPQSNQSLALIGDSILQLTIYRDWYPTRQLKGTGNQLVQTIGCNANLAKVALRIGLDHHIITAQDIVPPKSLLATTMEAVLGAIDCDSGEDANAVRKAMDMVGLTPTGTFSSSLGF